MSEAVQQAAAAVAPPPPPPPAAAPAPAAAAAAPAAPPAATLPPAPAPVVAPVAPAAPAAAAPAPEAKPPAPDTTKPDATAKPAAAAAPVEIEFQLPAGAQYAPEAITDLKALAKEHGITAKQAEALLALDQKHAQANAKAFQQKVEQQAKADIEALKADKEFGGQLYDKTVKAARSAAKQFFGEDFSKLMEATGLQNHPAVVKGLARIRKAIAEDSTSSRAPGSTPPAAEPQKMSRHERWKQNYLPKK